VNRPGCCPAKSRGACRVEEFGQTVNRLLVPLDPTGQDDDEQLLGLKEVDLESVQHPASIGVCQPARCDLTGELVAN